MPGRLLVVGELNPDVIVLGVPADHGRLRFGQAEDLVAATHLTLGSSAAITASAAAAAGIQVALRAVVGDDDLGRMCRTWVTERAIDATAVRVEAGASTGSTVVLVGPSGDRHMLTHLGTMRSLVAADLEDGLLADFDHLHVASFFMHEAVRDRLHERMAAARRLGLSVSLDTNDDPTRRWASGAQEALAQTDLLFVNENEATGLAGVGDPERAAISLLGRLADGPARPHRAELPAVVLKRGRDGAEVYAGVVRRQVGAPNVQVVDAVGAGDTLAGTVIVRLMDGRSWPDALAAGVAAASLSTTGIGGTGGQRSSSEVDSLARQLGCTEDPIGEGLP